ncbi:unnamed protein product, partial [Mesorhabditis belari]|uniref:C-type lectin domain-containing protein n=1 Tax=Mesorhabditis belari TaxID=2138241 RepID=A0AAF3J407_9BILA
MHSEISKFEQNDQILSNVANETDKVPNGDPCNYSWVWIGYVGTGELGNGTRDSYWTDESPVDYIGIPERGPGNASSLWMMVNDPSCSMKGWSWGGAWDRTGRFVCKEEMERRREELDEKAE